MRIEQPAHLLPLQIESIRRLARCFTPHFAALGFLFACFLLLPLRLRAASCRAVAPWGMPFTAGFGLLMPIAAWWARCWLDALGTPYAELDGGKLRVGPFGHTFRLRHLVYCRFEPDEHSPEIERLCFCIRSSRFVQPRYWVLLVGDRDEADDFRLEVLERASRAKSASRT